MIQENNIFLIYVTIGSIAIFDDKRYLMLENRL
jgi:hypothetical protein